MTGLQKELDLSWAGLGEVYGRQHDNDKNKLGIRVRRIKSNVDNEEKFAKSVNYVPEKLSFQTANADLLKLLVGPLYGNDPSIGIRELIQNAVDAVREMDDLISRGTLVSEQERWIQDADVQLIVDCNEADLPISISIVDRGVGMSISVLRDYFLRAGASFRKSEAWKSAHTDETGSSRVLRTGRFGVGALAAFLLGDEIEVTTRHYNSASSRGLNLKAKLDTDAIEVLYVEAPIGTKITVKLSELAQSQISKFRDLPSRFRLPSGEWKIDFDNKFGHYFLVSPKLSRTILPMSTSATVKSYLPADGSRESRPW